MQTCDNRNAPDLIRGLGLWSAIAVIVGTYARWHDAAYNYNSTQNNWNCWKDSFNKEAAKKLAELGRAARASFPDGHFFTSPMSADEARYRTAQQQLAADPNATLQPDIKTVYEKGPPAGMVESQSK